jgi:hypothetical protein
MDIVMIGVLHQDSFELTSLEDQHPVQTFSADGSRRSAPQTRLPGAIEQVSR